MTGRFDLRMAAVALAGLLLLAGLRLAEKSARAQTQDSEATARAGPGSLENERLMAIGKKLFLGRCAKCHNERGDKPLDSGLPLNQRKLTDEVIARNVTGRFKSATEEEKRGVALYIKSFRKN